MNYENSSEAPGQPYQYLTPLCSLVSESFTHFSGSSHYATPHNLHQTTPERTRTCPCSRKIRTLTATYAYPSYGLANMASRTPCGRKSDQQASNKEIYEPVTKPSDPPLQRRCVLMPVPQPKQLPSLLIKDKFEKYFAYINLLNLAFSTSVTNNNYGTFFEQHIC